jgi:negative regulator of sigma E activity
MKPIIKKVAAAVAIKEGVEKLQEMRKPKKPSLLQRLMPFGIVAAVAGLGLFVYKNKFSGNTASYDADTQPTPGTAGTGF